MEAERLGACFQLRDHVAIFKFHRTVAAVADQERHRMLGTVGMVASDERIDRFQFMHEAIGHQEIQRAIDGGRRIRTHAFLLTHPFQQLVGLDRLAGLGDQRQHPRADRSQAQAALLAGMLHRRHEAAGIVDVMMGVGAGVLGGHVWNPLMSPQVS